MKLEKIIKALPIFTSAAIRAATVNTNWLIASELMSAVEDRQAMLNLLRDLNEDADTLDQVTDKQIIKRLMDITQERFSTDVNSKFGFTEEEVGDYLTKFAATRSTSQATNRLNGKNPAKFLSGYGCWCRFGATNLKKGHGKTVDDIDKLCKTLTHGYECLKIDSTEDGTVPFCDPITTDYNFDIAKFLLVSNSFPAESLEDNCKNNNPGNACAEQTCIIELSSLVDLKLGLYKHSKDLNGVYKELDFDANYKHDNFDPDTECGTPGSMFPLPPNAGNPSATGSANANPASFGQASLDKNEKSCCGVFPKRFPYNKGNGSRDCCLDKTFNTATDCCDDFMTGVLTYGCSSP